MCDKVHYPPETGRVFADHPQLTWWDLGICGDAEMVTILDVHRRSGVFTILDSKTIPSRFPSASKRFNILLIKIQATGLVGTIGTASKQVYRVTTDAKRDRHYPMRAQAMWCRNESGPFSYHIEIVRPEGE